MKITILVHNMLKTIANDQIIPSILKNDFDVLRLDMKFDISELQKITKQILDEYRLINKDGYKTYEAIGLQYSDDGNQLYDAVQELSFTNAAGIITPQRNISKKSFTEINEIGKKFELVFKAIEGLGIKVLRGRILVAKPGHINSVHYDHDVRLHIPIFTNENCVSKFDKKTYHMPADGSAYLFNAYHRHNFENLSNENRVHLVFVIDFSLKSWQTRIFCEELPFRVNAEEIRKYFLENILQKYPPVWQNTYNIATTEMKTAFLDDADVEKQWGGWTIQSYDGSYKSGWRPLHWNMKENAKEGRSAMIPAEAKNADHIKPTEICKGPIADIVSEIEKMGFRPNRGRITCVPAKGSISWHNDANSNLEYAARIHIPIITNPNCYFETKYDKFYMKDDGSVYFLNINHPHRVVNDGLEHRFHIIFNAYDYNQVSKNIRFGI